MTVGEVAGLLRVSAETVRRYGRTGVLDVIELTSRTYRVRASSVRHLVEHQVPAVRPAESGDDDAAGTLEITSKSRT